MNEELMINIFLYKFEEVKNPHKLKKKNKNSAKYLNFKI